MEIIRKKGGAIFCALFIYLIATSFINQDVYAFTVRFASVLIFGVLCVLLLPYLAEDLKNKALEPVLVGLTVILSAVFVIITGSGYGAIFIPSDLALICYASGHIRLTGKEKTVTAFAGALPVAIWYSHVRWSYNFNMAGFAFMLMAFFGMLLTERVAEHVRIKGKRTGDRQRQAMEAMFFITAFILSMLYHSRTAMFGMLMFALVYALFRIMSTKKIVYRTVLFLASAGAVLWTAVYIRLADIFGSVTVLYKDIFSGRQAIWRELWEAFARQPLTGIGSAYELQSFDIFEVHNGMFDILVVHGIIVFLLILVLMARMFDRIHNDIAASDYSLHKINGADNAGRAYNADSVYNSGRIALSAALSMMFTSYFENFFTVPPYSLIFMAFILMAVREGQSDD